VGILPQHGPILLENLTVAGNRALGIGGGIALDDGVAVFTQSLTIESSTIADNSSNDRGGGIAFADFDSSSTPTPITPKLHNTIVANNTAASEAQGPDVFGSFGGSFNLVKDQAGSTLLGSNNVTNVDPLLGSLGDYGGGIPTKLPKPGSPALNAGDTAATTLTFDQRGLTRVVGGRIDIGADERQASEDTIFLDGLEGY
jgi:hypothetical protein